MTNPCSTSWPTSCTKEHGGGAYAAHTTRGGSARQPHGDASVHLSLRCEVPYLPSDQRLPLQVVRKHQGVAAFVFEDADFERLPGDLEPYQAYGDSFQAEFRWPGVSGHQPAGRGFRSPAGRTLVRAELRRGGGLLPAGTWLHQGIDGGADVPSKWQYRDSRTDEKFDFD